MEIHIKKLNETYGKIIAPYETLQMIMDRFAIPINNYWFNPLYKQMKYFCSNPLCDFNINAEMPLDKCPKCDSMLNLNRAWDGKIRFVQSSGNFKLGLFYKIKEYLKGYGIHWKIDKSLIEKGCTEDFAKISKENFSNWESSPWEHQLRAALKALTIKRGVIEHATGSGKSLVMALISNYLYRKNLVKKILIVVPMKQLVEQLRMEFVEEYECFSEDEVGIHYGKVKQLDRPITITTWQSIYKKKDFLREVDVLLLDECWQAKAEMIKSIGDNATFAKYKLGFTGTMPTKDKVADNYLIEGTTGPIIDREKSDVLMQKDILSKIKIYIHMLNYPKINNKHNYHEERSFIESYKPRTDYIKDITIKEQENGNVLLLAVKINHCKELFNTLSKSTKNVYFIDGSISVKDREEIRHHVENSNNNIIVATVGTFAVGINIKKLHCVIFGAARKSKIQTLQSIGRGLRKHKSKNILKLIDIADMLKYSKNHFKERLNYYTDENFDFEIIEDKLFNHQ